MRASFWQNFSLQALLVQKLKKWTLDGAKTAWAFIFIFMKINSQEVQFNEFIIRSFWTFFFYQYMFEIAVYCKSFTIYTYLDGKFSVCSFSHTNSSLSQSKGQIMTRTFCFKINCKTKRIKKFVRKKIHERKKYAKEKGR